MPTVISAAKETVNVCEIGDLTESFLANGIQFPKVLSADGTIKVVNADLAEPWFWEALQAYMRKHNVHTLVLEGGRGFNKPFGLDWVPECAICVPNLVVRGINLTRQAYVDLNTKENFTFRGVPVPSGKY